MQRILRTKFPTALAAALGIQLCVFSGAQAQTLPDPGTPEPPRLDPKACADRDRLTLGDTHQLQSKGTSGEGPSDRLARTGGVICPPPHLDPDIRVPAPGGGATPVIPPPAEGEPK